MIEPAPLSPRQTSVARLVADGLTNKQIGHELGISPATVKNHLHVALGKLGVPRRAAIGSRLAEMAR